MAGWLGIWDRGLTSWRSEGYTETRGWVAVSHVGQFPSQADGSILAFSNTGRWLIPSAGVVCFRHPGSYLPYFSCLQAKVFLLASQGRVTVNDPSSLTSSLGFPCCACEWQPKGTFSQTSSIGTMMPGLTTQCTCLSVYCEVCSRQCRGFL